MNTIEIENGLQLVLIEHAFASKYFQIVQKEREILGQWLVWPIHALSEEFFHAFIEKSLSDYEKGKSMTCAIIVDGKVSGNIGFNSINRDLKKVEIGYWLSKSQQGKGVITKSVSALIDIAFKELNMTKVQICVATGNTKSKAVCERLGFNLEGVITQAENLNGRIVDHAIYGLTCSS